MGKDLKVEISLNATRFSGYNYVNVSQLLNKMRLAGIQISIERNYDHNGTDIIAEVKNENIFRTNFMRSNLNFSFNEFDERESEDWFVTCLSEYLNYKSSDKGREETESEMALAYYDKLTDDWFTCGALNDELKAFSPFAETSYLSPKQELDENFGNFDNVISKLDVLLSETGFEMYLNQNPLYKKGVNFQICMREKDYILDSTTGQTKLLQKTASVVKSTATK